MILTTRCPQCGTSFRVQPAQLTARGGKVRCGRCNAVFDGVSGLLEQEPAAAQPAEAEPSPQLALFEAARRWPPLAAAEAANEEARAEFLDEQPPPPRRRLAWGLAALVALGALGAQAALHFRTELAVLVPEARPRLAAACAALGCELRLPRRPELITIESSGLHTEGPRENVIVLNAVIRNHAPFPQEYPALELTLTDPRDEVVARRVLAPADYLGAEGAAGLAQGIAPRAEATLRLLLETSDLRAVGYRLYLFYH